MKSALFLALLLGQQTPAPAPQSDTAIYTNYELGLTFNHPKTWTVETKKGRSTFKIPLEASAEQATLEIYPGLFNSEIDIWQKTQENISKQMRKEIVNQWQEEILGVPLLLTKTTSQEKGQTVTTVTGLMYSATPRKLVYRLTASPTEFDKADYAFRTALQSIRTVDGTMPKPEDPNRKVTEADLEVSNRPPKITKLVVPKRDPATYVKGPVTAEGEAGGKKLILRAPEGWTVAKGEGGAFTLTNPGLSGSATLTLASTLDSDSPGRALIRASGKSLGGFTKVSKRDEKLPYEVDSGAVVAYVWRTGAMANGEGAALDAYGLSGDHYYVLSWQGMGADTKASREQLMRLINILSIEVAP